MLDERIILHFGAVDQIARVSLNGKPLGEHIGGYLPFEFDITNSINDGENGFVFDDYNAHLMLHTINRAIEAFNDEEKWKTLVENAMTSDFTWKASAKKYFELYKN